MECDSSKNIEILFSAFSKVVGHSFSGSKSELVRNEYTSSVFVFTFEQRVFEPYETKLADDLSKSVDVRFRVRN